MRTSDKRSNLFGQLLSYEENEVLWTRTLAYFGGGKKIYNIGARLIDRLTSLENHQLLLFFCFV
jgi:hypothetical protein